jgi:hypothetical protein
VNVTSSAPGSFCLRIRDDGSGMHPKVMKGILTSFGVFKTESDSANDFNQSEHGIGLKINALRLGDTCLIVSRQDWNVSVGLISLKLIADSGSNYIVAPLVSFTIDNNEVFIPQTPFGDQLLQVVARYCPTIFSSDYDIKRYIVNTLPKNGTEILIADLRNPCCRTLGNELEGYKGDIRLSQAAIKYLNIMQDESAFEQSLFVRTRYMYITHPLNMRLRINQDTYGLKNPFEVLKRINGCLVGGGK